MPLHDENDKAWQDLLTAAPQLARVGLATDYLKQQDLSDEDLIQAAFAKLPAGPITRINDKQAIQMIAILITQLPANALRLAFEEKLRRVQARAK